jgi:hypothetical protein
MINDSGLNREEASFVLSCVGMTNEKKLLKTYFCGFESCKTRECFDTWKHIQQHYKNYHKVTIKKKEPWNEEIPKIREVESTEEVADAELSPRNKRKRSARIANQKHVGNGSPVTTIEPLEPENIKFTLLLSNATVLAKVTSDFSGLKDRIKNVVLNGMTKQDATISASVSAKLDEFNYRKPSLEHSIEMTKEFSPIQKDLLDGIAEMSGKELTSTIEFAKYYLLSLQLRELQKNPEYIALLALQNVLDK